MHSGGAGGFGWEGSSVRGSCYLELPDGEGAAGRGTCDAPGS